MLSKERNNKRCYNNFKITIELHKQKLKQEVTHWDSSRHKILQKNKREEWDYMNSRNKKKKEIKLSNKKNKIKAKQIWQTMIKNKMLLKRDFKILWLEENLIMVIWTEINVNGECRYFLKYLKIIRKNHIIFIHFISFWIINLLWLNN